MLNTRTTGVFNVNFEHMFHFFVSFVAFEQVKFNENICPSNKP